MVEFQVSGGHANEQPSLLRHFNGDLKIVLRAIADGQTCIILRALHLDSQLPGVVSISSRNAHSNLVLCAANNVKATRPQIHFEFAARVEIGRKWVILNIPDVQFSLSST